MPSFSPSLAPTIEFDDPGSFCTGGPDSIFLDHDASTSWNCEGEPNGKVKLAWKTTGVSSEGFSDDEYYVRLFQAAEMLYSSEQQISKYESTGDSGVSLLGSAGAGGFQVVFQCDLEFSFRDCEGGSLEFKVVDCGCPGGEDPLLDCTVSSFEKARNAVRTWI